MDRPWNWEQQSKLKYVGRVWFILSVLTCNEQFCLCPQSPSSTFIDSHLPFWRLPTLTSSELYLENITVNLLVKNNITRLHSRNGPCAKSTRIIYFDTININPILLVGIVSYGVLLFPIIFLSLTKRYGMLYTCCLWFVRFIGAVYWKLETINFNANYFVN